MKAIPQGCEWGRSDCTLVLRLLLELSEQRPQRQALRAVEPQVCASPDLATKVRVVRALLSEAGPGVAGCRAKGDRV